MASQGMPLGATAATPVLIDSVQTLAAGAQATASTRLDGLGRTMLTLGIPAGQTGSAAAGTNGVTPTITGGTITTLPAGSQATATLRPTGAASYALDLGLPAGAAGSNGTSSTGATGPAPILSGGTVTTLAAGAQATATLRSTGTGSYALDLGLPVGATGATGPTSALVPKFAAIASTDASGDATFTVPALTPTGYSADAFRANTTPVTCYVRARPAAGAAGTWTVRASQPVAAVLGVLSLGSVGAGVEVSLVIWGS